MSDSITGLVRRAETMADSLESMGLDPVAELVREMSRALVTATAPAPIPEGTAPPDYPAPYPVGLDED